MQLGFHPPIVNEPLVQNQDHGSVSWIVSVGYFCHCILYIFYSSPHVIILLQDHKDNGVIIFFFLFLSFCDGEIYEKSFLGVPVS